MERDERGKVGRRDRNWKGEGERRGWTGRDISRMVVSRPWQHCFWLVVSYR